MIVEDFRLVQDSGVQGQMPHSRQAALSMGLLAGLGSQESAGGYQMPGTPSAGSMPAMTRNEVKMQADAEGRAVFIIDNVVYDFSQFQELHPGGKEVCVYL